MKKKKINVPPRTEESVKSGKPETVGDFMHALSELPMDAKVDAISKDGIALYDTGADEEDCEECTCSKADQVNPYEAFREGNDIINEVTNGVASANSDFIANYIDTLPRNVALTMDECLANDMMLAVDIANQFGADCAAAMRKAALAMMSHETIKHARVMCEVIDK